MLLLTLAGSMFGSYYLNKGEIATLQAQVTTMNSQIPHLQDEVKSIQQMTDALRPQIAQIQKSLAELNLTRVTRSIDTLSARVGSALSVANAAVDRADVAVDKANAASVFIQNLNFSMSELVAARMRTYMETVYSAEQKINAVAQNITKFAQQLRPSLDRIRDSVTNVTFRVDRLESSLVPSLDRIRDSVTNVTFRVDRLESSLVPVIAHAPGYVLVRALTTQNLTIGSVISFGQPVGGQTGYPATVSFDSDSGTVLLAAGEIPVTFHLQMTLGASCSGADVRFTYAWKNSNGSTVGVEGTSSAPLTPAIAASSLAPWEFQKLRLIVTTSPSPVCVCRVTGGLLVDEV